MLTLITRFRWCLPDFFKKMVLFIPLLKAKSSEHFWVSNNLNNEVFFSYLCPPATQFPPPSPLSSNHFYSCLCIHPEFLYINISKYEYIFSFLLLSYTKRSILYTLFCTFFFHWTCHGELFISVQRLLSSSFVKFHSIPLYGCTMDCLTCLSW